MKTLPSLIAVTAILTLNGFTPSACADQTNVVVTGTTNTTGIVINGGNDTITVETNAAVSVSATNVPVVVAVDPDGGTNVVQNLGRVRATGTIPSSTDADLSVVAVQTGTGQNTVTNISLNGPQNGLIEATATVGVEPATGDEALTARATATGIASGGSDTIFNAGIIRAWATNTLTRAFPLILNFIGLENGTNSTTAEAIATGVASRGSTTSITSTGAVSATAFAKMNPFAINLTLEDVAYADATLNANATAVGIAGGTGTSSITNNGLVTANAIADVSSSGINQTLVNAVTADTSLNATANATGIAGGAGENTIANANQIIASAVSSAQTVAVTMSFEAVARGDAKLSPTAQAQGITGGAAGDQLSNDGSITAAAVANAFRLGVTSTLYDFTAAQELFDAGADTTTKAQATAVGMDGGLGNDWLVNSGSISATATSKVLAVDVALSSIGVPSLSQVTNLIFAHSLATLDRFSEANATGMAGGGGEDNILNAGSLVVSTFSDMTNASVNVGISLPVELPLGFLPGIPVATAGSSNSATAFGIDGGEGNDTIRNTATLNTTAHANALSIVASLNVAFNVTGLSIGIPIADAMTSGNAAATGIFGAGGDDTIINEIAGQSTVNAISEVSGWLVSADITGAIEGLDVGVAMATAAVSSEAKATGIDSGAGNDQVRNEGGLNTTATAEADNNVVSLKVTGVAEGVAVGVTVADATTTAKATATGILGGAGNDEIVNAITATNTVKATSDVESLGIAVSIIGPTEGLAVSVGKVEVSTLAEAQALGIDGGAGTNTIRNMGFTGAYASATNLNIGVGVGITVTLDTGLGLAGAQVNAVSEVRVESTGISAGNDGSTVINDGIVRATADTDAQTVSVGVTANIGIGAGVLDTDASTTANSIAMGIQGGTGDDVLINSASGDISATAKSLLESDSVGLNLSIIGAAFTDASASATNLAIGMAGGDGLDFLSNAGVVKATADASVAIDEAGVNIIGATLTGQAEAGTTAHATAVGLDGGAGNDQLANQTNATIEVAATAFANVNSVSVQVAGDAETDAPTTAKATGTGMAGGDGLDLISNAGMVKVTAGASNDVNDVGINLVGAALTGKGEAGTTANALAVGLDGGAGNDQLANQTNATIEVVAMAFADVNSVSVELVGDAETKAITTVNATGTGIAGGDGLDLISNAGMVKVTAGASNDINQVGINLVGATLTGKGEAGTTANAVAVGLDGGAGDDQLANQTNGTIEVVAKALANVNSVSILLVGDAETDAATTVNATGTGITGGDGLDLISNAGMVKVTADASNDVSEVGINLVGAVLTGKGEAGTTANATAVGLDGGAGNDQLANQTNGTIEVVAKSFADVSTSSILLVGDAETDAATTVNATGTGMAGGDGLDLISNAGTINVTAGAGADVDSTSVSLVGAALAGKGDAGTTVEAVALGLDGGAGDDQLANQTNATIEVVAKSFTDVNSTSVELVGDAETDAATTVIATGTGMAGGDGLDFLSNAGLVKVTADASNDVGSASVSLIGAALAGKGDAGTTVEAVALGLDGGAGDDALANRTNGTIEVKAKSFTDVNSTSVGLIGDAEAEVATTAKATGTGMAGGDGLDSLSNAGLVKVTADASADTDSASIIIIGESLAGKGGAGTTVEAVALGLDGGAGNDSLINSGTIDVFAKVKADGGAFSLTVFGDAQADGATTLRASGTGMTGNSGDDQILNTGTNKLAALTDIKVSNESIVVFGAGSVDVSITAEGRVIGIDGGDGEDIIDNTGWIEARARGTNTFDNSTYSIFGSASANGSITGTNSASGIEGGEGFDQIHNLGQIEVETVSISKANASSWTLAGGASGSVFGKPVAQSTGIAAGAGANGITNSGSINVQATAISTANGNSTTVFGGASASPANEAAAEAIGLTAGGEADVFLNQGSLELVSTAEATATGNGYSAISFADQHATGRSEADAYALAIDAGNGSNQVQNAGSISVMADATATANAKADEDAGFVNDLTADATTQADSLASGIVTGNGHDQISNSGTNRVTATVNSTADAYSDGAWSNSGNANATADATGSLKAVGIDAGADPELGGGNDRIENTGFLETTVEINITAKARADEVGKATAMALAEAYGIVAGDGHSTIINSGLFSVVSTNVKATALITQVDNQEQSYPSSTVTNFTYGIVVGQGNNLIANEGTLQVTAGGSAYSAFNADDDGSVAASKTWAEAYGIKTGYGDNTIRNTGDLTVTSTNVTAKTENSDDEPDNATSTTVVNNRSHGVLVGDGANLVVNDGILSVEAAANATTLAKADWHFADAYATAVTEAYGIKVGNGANTITNSSQLTVTARAKADATAYADFGIGADADRAKAIATADAKAVGISTGNDGNLIVNTGSINVTAIAVTSVSATGDAASKPTQRNRSVQAIGIQTGDGNDTIVNSGYISAITTKDGLAGIGTAIDTGAGDDQLVLAGSPTIIGNVTGGEGTDTLVLQGAGSFGLGYTGSVAGFENAAKHGPGTFTLGIWLPTMQRLEVTEGVLELPGDYTFQGTDGAQVPEGYFGVNIWADGSHCQLLVLGQATLGGEIDVVKQPGFFLHGAAYDVLVASNDLVNAFSSTNLPPAKPLLRFELRQLADRVQISTEASFQQFGRNPVERAVGEYLDRIAPSVTGDLSDVLMEFQNLPGDPQIATAYSSLSPDSYDNYSRATDDLVQQYSQSVQQRLNTLRLNATVAAGGAERAVLGGHNPVLLTFAGPAEGLGGLFARQQPRAEDKWNAIWASGFGQWNDQEAEDGYTGFSSRPWGMAIGYDRALGEELTLGISGAYASTHLNLDENLGSGDIGTYSGAVYGSYFKSNFHLEGVLSYGYNDYDNQRNLVIGSIARQAQSSHTGQALGAFLSGGYICQFNHWALEPFASLQYTYLDEDGFLETGAGGANLSVQDRQTQALVSELGVRLAYVLRKESFTFVPELSLAWNYDFGMDDRVISASYAGTPNAAFNLPSQEVEPHGLTTGAGVTFLFGKGISTSVRYNGELRDGYSSHAVLGELRFAF